MKSSILKIMRMKAFQPIWEKLFHFSKIGMNFWGGATFSHSGEIYALKYAKEKLSGKSNPVIFDVGANVGEYAFAAAEIFGKKCVIYSFEPSGFTFRALHKSIQDSSASEYIRAENFGYSDSRAKVNLYSSGRGATIASVYELKRSSVEFKKEFIEEIELRTIDDYCTENDIQNIDYLKVDIEGHEYQALLGAIKMIEAKRIKFIQFEFGECHIDSRTFFRDFYELLSPHYRFHRIVSDGIREVKEYSTDLEVFDTVNYLLELK